MHRYVCEPEHTLAYMGQVLITTLISDVMFANVVVVDMCLTREHYVLKNDYDELGKHCGERRKQMLGRVRS